MGPAPFPSALPLLKTHEDVVFKEGTHAGAWVCAHSCVCRWVYGEACTGVCGEGEKGAFWQMLHTLGHANMYTEGLTLCSGRKVTAACKEWVGGGQFRW